MDIFETHLDEELGGKKKKKIVETKLKKNALERSLNSKLTHIPPAKQASDVRDDQPSVSRRRKTTTTTTKRNYLTFSAANLQHGDRAGGQTSSQEMFLQLKPAPKS